MKTIGIFTTTRAEFGILSAFLREINQNNNFEYRLFVGGAHLAVETGKTINEIQAQNYRITAVFDYQLNSSDEYTLAKSLGFCCLELANIFHQIAFDYVCVLGDRVELLPIITNAILFRKPIIHLHGGERTEGSIDEQVRHMVTKASHIHFAACQEYAENIIHMGEEVWRVYNVGALAVDNMIQLPKKTKKGLFSELGLNPDIPTVLLTYHPVTLEFKYDPLQQIRNIFEALAGFKFQVLITSPNIDHGREIILNFIKEQLNLNPLIVYKDSLGVKNYLNLIPFCEFVIGNSSSAIIEVPFFKIPVINIGNRQEGRIMHENILSCDYSAGFIKKCILRATNFDFRTSIQKMQYKFGDGNSAKKMLEILGNIEINESLLKKKLVY